MKNYSLANASLQPSVHRIPSPCRGFIRGRPTGVSADSPAVLR